MKLASFTHAGHASWGVVADDALLDLGAVFRDRAPTLRAAIEAHAWDEIAALSAAGNTPRLALDQVSLLPVIPVPGKILCIGLNYEEHRIESRREPTGHPVIFTRFADSQVGHQGAIVRPAASRQLDYEGELAIVIGKAGRHIDRAAAWSHVAGYACYNEGSVRDWQRHTSQYLAGKTFAGTGAFGPWLVTTDEIPDPAALTLETRLNGQVVQHSTTDLMITPVPDQIAYISTILPLLPGDVIVSGTPGGVGSKRKPPLWMRAGDVAEVEISRIGVLRNTVVAEERA